MSNVLNRTTMLYLESVHTPDYPEEDWLVNPDLSNVSGVPPRHWVISGSDVLEMDAAAKAAVDGALIPGAMRDKILDLDEATREFVEDVTRYPPHRQRTLTQMMSEAHDAGQTNREAYIQQLWDWLGSGTCSVFDHFYEKRDEIVGQTTLAGVADVAWDFSTLSGCDPQVSIETARGILD